MSFIKRFNSKHYAHFLPVAEKYMNNYENFNDWVKQLSNVDLVKWMGLVMLINDDNSEYYEEYSILLSIIIRFFIIELEVDVPIKLNTKEIQKLIKKFQHGLYREYSNRNAVVRYKEEDYKLLG